MIDLEVNTVSRTLQWTARSCTEIKSSFYWKERKWSRLSASQSISLCKTEREPALSVMEYDISIPNMFIFEPGFGYQESLH